MKVEIVLMLAFFALVIKEVREPLYLCSQRPNIFVPNLMEISELTY
jgi:hypothetical protein